MREWNRAIRSKAGQGITEVALILPLLLLLGLGVIEVSNMINSYLTLTHITREGANSISRGIAPPGEPDITSCTDPDGALDAMVVSANPVIRCDNQEQWRIIYSKIKADSPTSSNYIVEQQITRGSLSKASQVGIQGSQVSINMADVDPGQTFHAIEVFYEYAPSGCTDPLNCPLTPIQNFTATFFPPGMNLPTTFYDRTIFTDVS